MVLGFMQKFPWGEPTNFREKIEQIIYAKEIVGLEPLSPKLHTIRQGQRWKAGQPVQMATGVRTKHYIQFNKGIPELEKIKAVQRIDISLRGPECVALYIDLELRYLNTPQMIKGREWFIDFVQNDGLTEDQFFRYFKKSLRNGQLLHFTDLKY